jgi:hypothetical protein
LNPPTSLAELGGAMADFIEHTAPAGSMLHSRSRFEERRLPVSIMDAQAEWLKHSEHAQKITEFNPDIIGCH